MNLRIGWPSRKAVSKLVLHRLDTRPFGRKKEGPPWNQSNPPPPPPPPNRCFFPCPVQPAKPSMSNFLRFSSTGTNEKAFPIVETIPFKTNRWKSKQKDAFQHWKSMHSKKKQTVWRIMEIGPVLKKKGDIELVLRRSTAPTGRHLDFLTRNRQRTARRLEVDLREELGLAVGVGPGRFSSFSSLFLLFKKINMSWVLFSQLVFAYCSLVFLNHRENHSSFC